IVIVRDKPERLVHVYIAAPVLTRLVEAVVIRQINIEVGYVGQHDLITGIREAVSEIDIVTEVIPYVCVEVLLRKAWLYHHRPPAVYHGLFHADLFPARKVKPARLQYVVYPTEKIGPQVIYVRNTGRRSHQLMYGGRFLPYTIGHLVATEVDGGQGCTCLLVHGDELINHLLEKCIGRR